MATQPFDNVHLLTASPSLLAPQLQMNSYAPTVAGAEVLRNEADRAEAQWPAEAIVNLHLLGKGVGWAIAIESAAALSIYGIWYLCHLWL
ncbi:MAG: hypothetical protein ACLPLZ_02230 [Terracidiphilus sp.]